MSILKKSYQTLILGGIFLIFPLLIVIVLIEKAVQLLLPLGKKLSEIFELHSVFGTAAVTIVCLVLILLLCLLGGVLVNKGFVHQYSRKVEEKLFLFFPSFQMLKYRLLGDKGTKSSEIWEAILIKEENTYRIAFITDESKDGHIAVYIPDAPRMDAGEIRYFKKGECDYLRITMGEAMSALNGFGKGIKALEFPKAAS
jgi:uncharacterized membrane protein